MSAYRYLTSDAIVSGRACRLLSVVITTDGGGPGKIVLYDERSAVSGREVATLLCSANSSKSFRWSRGLELHRGLFVDFVEKADYATVEWEPAEGPPVRRRPPPEVAPPEG